MVVVELTLGIPLYHCGFKVFSSKAAVVVFKVVVLRK